MNFTELRKQIEGEIASYVYEVPKSALGQAMPTEWVAAQLAEFKAALVEPARRVVAISDSTEQMLGRVKPELRECILVADDREGYELYYDPSQRDFVLAYSGNPPVTFNVRGDAVGCFMAR
jgi:CelD/BcsL family acetyltransferase involved in cellulose biosynthesis